MEGLTVHDCMAFYRARYTRRVASKGTAREPGYGSPWYRLMDRNGYGIGRALNETARVFRDGVWGN